MQTCGLSLRAFALEIQVPKSTVESIMKRYSETSVVDNLPGRGGKTKLSGRLQRKSYCQENPTSSFERYPE